MSVRLHVWGERACFTRPEFKAERVSYPALTPSAARGILEAIHWKPAIAWQVRRIHVLKPIRFVSIRRNEVAAKANGALALKAFGRGDTQGLGIVVEDHRQQRASLVLDDVAYVIEAGFVMTGEAGLDDTAGKHLAMFNRRAERGQCFHRPCLGTREFAADFALVGKDEALPESDLSDDQKNADLGLMLHDFDFGGDGQPRFFRAALSGGVIEVPPFDQAGPCQAGSSR